MDKHSLKQVNKWLMFYMHIFVLLALALLTGCTDAAYHQPVYIISDSTQEEEVEYVAPEPDINNER